MPNYFLGGLCQFYLDMRLNYVIRISYCVLAKETCNMQELPSKFFCDFWYYLN